MANGHGSTIYFHEFTAKRSSKKQALNIHEQTSEQSHQVQQHGCCPVHSPPPMFEFHSFIHLGEGPAAPLHLPQAHFLSREHPNAEDCKAAP